MASDLSDSYQRVAGSVTRIRGIIATCVAVLAWFFLTCGAGSALAQDAPASPSGGQAVPRAPSGPADVTIRLYINDIQDIDFKTNSYIVDLYLWLRWNGKDLDPIKSVEFMNIFDPESQQKTVLFDVPKEMPDGSLYNVIRYQGRFAKKFRFEKYPFDRQLLDFVIEDSVSGEAAQRALRRLRLSAH